MVTRISTPEEEAIGWEVRPHRHPGHRRGDAPGNPVEDIQSVFFHQAGGQRPQPGDELLHPVMADPQKYGFTASLRKPFRRAELSELLSRYLAP